MSGRTPFRSRGIRVLESSREPQSRCRRHRRARRRARQAFDQERGQARRNPAGDLDDRSDHARGQGLGGQGPAALPEGAPAAAGRCDASRLSRRSASTPTSSRSPGGALAGSSIKVASVATGFPSGLVPLAGQARRDAARRRGRRRRGRHGHRPRRLPVGRARPGRRRDRARSRRPAARRISR